jgi:hypothetical protein
MLDSCGVSVGLGGSGVTIMPEIPPILPGIKLSAVTFSLLLFNITKIRTDTTTTKQTAIKTEGILCDFINEINLFSL